MTEPRPAKEMMAEARRLSEELREARAVFVAKLHRHGLLGVFMRIAEYYLTPEDQREALLEARAKEEQCSE